MVKRDNIKDFLKKIRALAKPLDQISELTDNENLAALLRRKYLEEQLGFSLSATGSSILDFVELENRVSYKPIGAIQIPITVIGPVEIEGVWNKGEKYIPLASIYPALMKAVDLGSKLLSSTKIRLKTQRCWLRLFTISTRQQRIDLCRLVEDVLASTYNLRILCYGRGSGHIINTVMIGDEAPCQQLREILTDGLIKNVLFKIEGYMIPVVTPYLNFDIRIIADISKGSLDEFGIEHSLFIETYNTMEDLRPIDNSLHPIILGVLSSLYTALGLKPEYGLRSEIRQHMLASRFRKIVSTLEARVSMPIEIRNEELTLMNKELIQLLRLEENSPFSLSEIAGVVIMISYTGLLASIAKEASRTY